MNYERKLHVCFATVKTKRQCRICGDMVLGERGKEDEGTE